MPIAKRFVYILAVAAIPAAAGCSCGSGSLFPAGGDGGGGEGATGDIGAAGPGGGGVGGVAGAGGTGGMPAECGDGVATGDEACDGADLKGASCVDLGFGSPGGLACTAGCEVDASGCAAVCDGALLEPGEVCDGADLGGHDCTEMGFVSPAGAVCAACAVDYGGCAAQCGNGAAEPGEVCDGADLGGHDCTELGYVGAAGLACNGACNGVSAAGCKAACNGTLEPGEVCDGANLNGFDCTQAGFSDPAGASCAACQIDTSGCAPTCGDGVVEPGEECDDGNVAGGDGCSSSCTLGGATCADAIAAPIAPGTTTITGTTAGGGVASGTCASLGPSRVYAVTPTTAGFLTASLTRAGTLYPSVLHARTECANVATQILCADSADPMSPTPLTGGEVLSFPVSANQTVYVFVDGAAANDAGVYELVLDLSSGTGCGDPVPVRIEKGSAMRLLGFTNGKTQSTGGSCGGGGPGTGAEDVVYEVNFVGAGNVTAAIDAAATSYNSVLYARTSCNSGGSQISCDNPSGNGGESITFNPNNDPTIYVWVDGSNGAEGTYSLVLTPAP